MRLSEDEYRQLCKNMGKEESIQKPARAKSPKKTEPADKTGEKFDSRGEENFYYLFVVPKIRSGEFLKCRLHEKFVVADAVPEYDLKKKVFTPDFIIERKDGEVEVVEIKGTVVRRLQRDYPLRKHLFIEKYCIPNGWRYREEESEKWA